MKTTELFQTRLKLVLAHLAKHPDEGRERIAKAIGIPKASVGRVLRTIRKETPYSPAADVPDCPGQRVLESPLSRTAPTLQSLIDECGVDLKRDKIDRHVINRYEQGSKHPETGGITVVPLWQIKAWVSPIEAVKNADIVRETIEWIRENSPVTPRVEAKPKAVQVDDPVMLEISVPDLHLGKLTWAPETGENYDIKIASHVHQQAVEALWSRASVFPVSKILLVCGNDLFNSDNARNETSAGTPQQEDDRWAKTFKVGTALLHRAIEFLRTRAPEIEVRFIAGNHDRERLFYAGEVIAAMYKNAEGVTVVNQPRVRQYLQWGTVLLGLAHGDGAKQDKLPLIMASEAAALWGVTTHRELHLGHYHHKRETQYHAGNEHNAVRVRILPSLTTADVWHATHGFVGQRRAAEAFLWAKKAGYLGHLSWSP